MKIGTKQTLLFIGDSITDCGRSRPIGERNGLGNGYVAIVDSLLASFYPEASIHVVNTGIGGNRVTDLAHRWQTDAIDIAPDWLSIMIGINDVARQFDSISLLEQIDPERFESTYRELLGQIRDQLKGLTLMTPFYLETNTEDPMRKLMDVYGKIVKRIANDYDAMFVDTQYFFNQHLKHRPTQSMCGDRVHPNQTGHMILAKAFLQSIDFDWSHNKK